MKIAVTTDNHWGFSKKGDKANEAMFQQLVVAQPDAIIQAGDASSHIFEQKDEFWTMVRTYHPTIPILTVMGNHDWWHKASSAKRIYSPVDMLNATDRVFTKHGITHLTPTGAMLGDNIFVNGFDGWYYDCQMTNDPMRIPGYDNIWFTSRANRAMADCIKESLSVDAKFKILVSHFGFLAEERETDWKAKEEGIYYGGNPAFEELLIEYDMFIYGHSHREFSKRHSNGRTYCLNPGSDYENPKVQLATVGA